MLKIFSRIDSVSIVKFDIFAVVDSNAFAFSCFTVARLDNDSIQAFNLALQNTLGVRKGLIILTFCCDEVVGTAAEACK